MYFCVNKCSGSTHDSNWVFHVISNRRLFIIYKLGYFGVVKMGNHGKYRVVSNGNVSWFWGIWHVLNLKLNLTSTEKLDDRGFTSHFANRVWRDTCCSLYKTMLQDSKLEMLSLVMGLPRECGVSVLITLRLRFVIWRKLPKETLVEFTPMEGRRSMLSKTEKFFTGNEGSWFGEIICKWFGAKEGSEVDMSEKEISSSCSPRRLGEVS